MNSLACHARSMPRCTNRALGPTPSLAIGPALQFTRSSGYSAVDEDRLKQEQSMTSDLPLSALTIEMREGILAASAGTIKSSFGEAPAVHFRRTAHALATLEPQTKKEQEATMGCLPVFISKISMGFKKQQQQEQEQTPLCAKTPRRQLLPPPKTVFLPSGDPAELRLIVEELQQKRSQALEQARITARLKALPALQEQNAASPLSHLATEFKSLFYLDYVSTFKRLTALLGDLIDRLAVA